MDVWGKSKAWTHTIIFKVVNENGSLYFYPSKKTAEYIYPWDEVVEYASTDKKTGCISGDCSNGYGVYIFSSGEKYEGYWKNL